MVRFVPVMNKGDPPHTHTHTWRSAAGTIVFFTDLSEVKGLFRKDSSSAIFVMCRSSIKIVWWAINGRYLSFYLITQDFLIMR